VSGESMPKTAKKFCDEVMLTGRLVDVVVWRKTSVQNRPKVANDSLRICRDFLHTGLPRIPACAGAKRKQQGAEIDPFAGAPIREDVALLQWERFLAQ